jgi:membrane-bound lytic murein transglycosylase D
LAPTGQVQYDPLLPMSRTRWIRPHGRARVRAARGLRASSLASFLARAFALVVVVVVPAPLALGAEGNPPSSGSPGKRVVPHAETRPEKAHEPDRESPSERRAVRGSPVEESLESPELSELRQFEEETFAHGSGRAAVIDSDAPEEAPPELGGRWEGSGDVPEPLRTPDRGPATTPGHPSAAASALPDSDWLRSLQLPEIPVRWDPAVLHYLDYFRSHPRGHAIMGNWLRRAGRYRGLIEATLEKEGLPKDLIYLAMVESGFDTGARSRVGAGGIWQFMPGAARAYGLEVGYWLDARRDPERSAEAAARYLKDLYVRFGSWHLVFAAYNAGYGAVLQSITRYNTNDYWELCRHEAGLPWESSLYVPKILAAAIVGHNPQAFGFGDLVPDPPLAFERVEVPGGTNLSTVARAIGVRPEAVAALNPQISRDRVPPDRATFGVRIPPGSSALFADGFARLRGTSDRLDTVTLRFGETLEAVAKARGVSTRELRRLNGVKDSAELRAGVAILVPRRKDGPNRGPAAGLGAGLGRGANGEDLGGAMGPGPGQTGGGGVGDPDDDDQVLVAVPDRVFNYEGRERVFYQTRDADTLEEVAEVFGVRVDDLVEWNSLDQTAKLHPKMVLQVFVRKDFDPRNVVLLDSARVRVVTLGSREFLELEAARRGKKRLVVEARAGDTLAKLGRRYGLTVGDLARINRFSYDTELQGGQEIVVYSPSGAPLREVGRGMAVDPRRDRERPRVSAALTRPAGIPRPESGRVSAGETRPAARVGSHPGGAGRAKSSDRKPPERKLAETRISPGGKTALARTPGPAGSGSGRAAERPKSIAQRKSDGKDRLPSAGPPGKGVSRRPK